MKIQESIGLAPYTTFGIGGPARFFAVATSEAEVVAALAHAERNKLRLFVLGGGSNLLVNDDGFDGLVLRIDLRGVQREPDSVGGAFRYTAGAGEVWDDFVGLTVGEGFAGLECLSGIPGTVGGTPVQNVGAYGQEVSTTIRAVRAFDRHTESLVELSTAECEFAYRTSRFNSREPDRFIVLRVCYELSPGPPQLTYRDLIEHFKGGATEPSLEEARSAVREIRRRKGMLIVPGDADCRSAGSFFKNPVVALDALARLREAADAEPPRFEAGPGQVKVPAAWLIEKAGFTKGYSRGSAAISSRHPLALVNRGGATAADILGLAREVRDRVRQRFNITLRPEPVMVGFTAPPF